MKTIIFTLILFFLFLPSSLAIITCNPCYVGNCQCTITDCSSGTFGVYTTQDCSGIPSYYQSFSGGSVTWSPSQAGTYYLRAYCDGASSSCTLQQVSSGSTTTSTTSTTTTTAPQCAFSLLSLSLTPNSVNSCPSTITAQISYSSANCGSQTVYIRKGNCSGAQVAVITTSDGSTSGSSTFQVTSSSDTGVYYACYDNQAKPDELSVTCVSPTTTSTTSTTTIPPTKIQCGECFARSKCKCTFTESCDANSMWLLQNKEKNPLNSTIITQIPPTTIEFETKEAGKISITVVCFAGSKISIERQELEVKEPFLDCDKECEVLKPCECRINGCKDGYFTAALGTTLLKWREKINTTSNKPNFISEKPGVVDISLTCNDPARYVEAQIAIFSPTPPKKFTGENFYSKEMDGRNKLTLDIENYFTEDVIIVFTINKDGEAMSKTYTAKPGSGTAYVTFDCESLKIGTYQATWKAFKYSDKKNPIAWSRLDELVNVKC
jgi:hypothetical protein